MLKCLASCFPCCFFEEDFSGVENSIFNSKGSAIASNSLNYDLLGKNAQAQELQEDGDSIQAPLSEASHFLCCCMPSKELTVFSPLNPNSKVLLSSIRADEEDSEGRADSEDGARSRSSSLSALLPEVHEQELSE